MTIHRPLMLVALAEQFFAGAALAADGATFILAPGEARSGSIGSTDRGFRRSWLSNQSL